jgi:hypothetical protein
MPGRKSGTELDDLNLHVKSPLANDLASRFSGLEYFSGGLPGRVARSLPA